METRNLAAGLVQGLCSETPEPEAGRGTFDVAQDRPIDSARDRRGAHVGQ